MAGMFGFDKALLAKWRTAVDDPTLGTELEAIINNLDMNTYEVVGQHYQRVPRGFAAEHPRTELLKYNALYAHPRQELDAQMVTSPQLVATCLAHFAAMSPIQQWLVKNHNCLTQNQLKTKAVNHQGCMGDETDMIFPFPMPNWGWRK